MAHHRETTVYGWDAGQVTGQQMTYRVIIGLPRWHGTGPTIFAERLTRALNAAGHEAHILLTESGCNNVQEGWIESEVPADIPYALLPAGANDTWGQRWGALERYLEERAPCFYLMLHDWRNNIVASRLSNRIRLVGLVQADSELEVSQVERLGVYWQAIVAVSEPLQFKLASRFPHLAPRIHSIPNAVPDLSGAPQKEFSGPLEIVYAGELRPQQKRLHDMAEVALQLAERGVVFRLTFYGDGSYRESLEKKLAKLINSGIVSLPGKLSNPSLLEALKTKHVFLLTSEYEGLSIAMLEAMSRGCVPVVSKLATQSEIVHANVNALTAEVGNIKQFADHLEALARDKNLLSKLSTNAFSSIRNGGYGISNMVKSYLALFEKIQGGAAANSNKRIRSSIQLPPKQIGETSIIAGNHLGAITDINRKPMWPDPLPPKKAPTKHRFREVTQPLEEYKIFVSAVPHSPDSISGVDVFSMHLVRGLRKRGLDARIITTSVDASSRAPYEWTDLPFEVNISHDFLGWPERWQQLIGKLSDNGPSIYIPNYDYKYSAIAPMLPEWVRVVGIGHSDDPEHYEHLCRIGHGCDAIVGVSHAITNHLRQLDSDNPACRATIPYGVPPYNGEQNTQRSENNRRWSDRLRVVYTGRLVREQKRAEDVIAIAKELARRNISYEMVIIGDGEMLSPMINLAGELTLEGTIRFLGKQPNRVILKFLETCDILLLPSAYEGLSVSMLEAMSRSVVPIVSSIRSGVPDIITHGQNGLIAPIADIQCFADHIERLANNPDDLQRLGSYAAATIQENYLVDHMIDRYIELFEKVISKQTVRVLGPTVPPQFIAQELRLSSWVRRVAADPMASLRRVSQRFSNKQAPL